MNSMDLNIFGDKLGNFFQGVFPCDFLNQRFDTLEKKKRYGIIVNTCTSDIVSVYCHWIAIYVSNGKMIYFDSLAGKTDQQNTFIKKFIKKQKFRKKVVNKIKIQDDTSEKCGVFAICFLHMMKNGYSMKQFLKIFNKNKNLIKNDEFVEKLFELFFLKDD